MTDRTKRNIRQNQKTQFGNDYYHRNRFVRNFVSVYLFLCVVGLWM